MSDHIRFISRNPRSLPIGRLFSVILVDSGFVSQSEGFYGFLPSPYLDKTSISPRRLSSESRHGALPKLRKATVSLKTKNQMGGCCADGCITDIRDARMEEKSGK